MTAIAQIRIIRPALAELPPTAKSRAKLEELATSLREGERRRADYAARGRAAWATRQKASRRRS